MGAFDGKAAVLLNGMDAEPAVTGTDKMTWCTIDAHHILETGKKIPKCAITVKLRL